MKIKDKKLIIWSVVMETGCSYDVAHAAFKDLRERKLITWKTEFSEAIDMLGSVMQSYSMELYKLVKDGF